MLFSIALILLIGMFIGWLCGKLRLPNLLGMILTGILLGPYVFNLVDNSILAISARYKKDCINYYFNKSRPDIKPEGLKKGRKTSGFDVFRSRNF